jgi:uncharacterized protein (TIRG00374 family)
VLMKYIKIILLVLIVGVLLYFFLQNVDFEEVISIIKGLNPIYPIVFFLGLFLQFFVRSYRWGILLKPHKEKISIFTLYNYTIIGFFISTLIPGRVGEPARAILLAREEKISGSFVLASVVLERLIDSIMVVLLFLVSLFFIDVHQFPFLLSLRKIAYFVFPLMLLVLLLFYLLNTDKVFRYVEKMVVLLSKLIPSRIRERATAFLLNFVKGLRLDLSLADFIKLALLSPIVWLFLVPFYWFLMRGFDFGSGIGIVESIPYFSIIVASAAIPTPGMAGSFDAASRHALEQLYGVGTNAAAAYTLLVHFIIILAFVIPGLIAVWTKGVNLKTVRNLKGEKDEMS